MVVEFLANEGFTDAQVAQLESERKQLEKDLLKTPEMQRFRKGESPATSAYGCPD